MARDHELIEKQGARVANFALRNFGLEMRSVDKIYQIN